MSASSSAPVSRLMLVLPASLPAKAMTAATAAGDVAAVILRPAGNALPKPEAVAAAQMQGAAVLLAGPAEAASRADLDGVHAEDGAALTTALRVLKGEGIVGAGGLASRHAAMEAGESGVDYVLFGALDPLDGDAARTLDLVAWWADLFEVPCVAVAASLDEAEAFAAAGADFVCLAEALASDPKAVAEAQRRITLAADGAGS